MQEKSDQAELPGKNGDHWKKKNFEVFRILREIQVLKWQILVLKLKVQCFLTPPNSRIKNLIIEQIRSRVTFNCTKWPHWMILQKKYTVFIAYSVSEFDSIRKVKRWKIHSEFTMEAGPKFWKTEIKVLHQCTNHFWLCAS